MATALKIIILNQKTVNELCIVSPNHIIINKRSIEKQAKLNENNKDHRDALEIQVIKQKLQGNLTIIDSHKLKMSFVFCKCSLKAKCH